MIQPSKHNHFTFRPLRFKNKSRLYKMDTSLPELTLIWPIFKDTLANYPSEIVLQPWILGLRHDQIFIVSLIFAISAKWNLVKFRTKLLPSTCCCQEVSLGQKKMCPYIFVPRMFMMFDCNYLSMQVEKITLFLFFEWLS